MARARSAVGQLTDKLGIGPHSNFVMFLLHVTKPRVCNPAYSCARPKPG